MFSALIGTENDILGPLIMTDLLLSPCLHSWSDKAISSDTVVLVMNMFQFLRVEVS